MNVLIKKYLLWVTVSFCVIPSFSYSYLEDERAVADSLASDFKRFLQEKNIEGLRQTIDSTNKILRNAEIPIMKRLKIRTVMKKVIKSASNANGDNILHLLIRLGQSDTVKQEGDCCDISKEMEFVYEKLGPRQFLRFLVKSNNKGTYPLLEANSRSNELTRKSFWTFVLRKRDEFYRYPFMRGFAASTFLLSGIYAFSSDPGILGAGLIAVGAGSCYRTFKTKKNLHTVNSFLPID